MVVHEAEESIKAVGAVMPKDESFKEALVLLLVGVA